MTIPDLNLLIALDVLLAEGSVALAARRLQLSPSAMSRTLARLRDADVISSKVGAAFPALQTDVGRSTQQVHHRRDVPPPAPRCSHSAAIERLGDAGEGGDSAPLN